MSIALLDAVPAERFRVLFVCTGNICRSPYAELLARHLLTAAGADAFEVTSAGVRAVVGAQVHPHTRRELARWGLDGDAAAGRFRARQLTPSMVERADLVLGVERLHRGAVVEQVPAALGRAFGLREFARLVATVDRGRLPGEPVRRARVLVERARAGRPLVPYVGPEADRIPDPMGGSRGDHGRAARLVEDALWPIISGVGDIELPSGGRAAGRRRHRSGG